MNAVEICHEAIFSFVEISNLLLTKEESIDLCETRRALTSFYRDFYQPP